MKHFLTFISIALVGCSSLDIPIVNSQVVGCYISDDQLGYQHTYLKVYESGQYSIENIGHVSSRKPIEGNWTLKNNELYLVASQTQNDIFVVNPKMLYVILNNQLFSTLNNQVNYLSFDATQTKGKYSKSSWGVFEFGACEL
jgi:hypothetical protein